ncbi:MAG TPA: flagellar transcriptional regulator FlhD [Burkholderiaceae bacterium]|nr:flagellar transcriptional regulator FlhD [Burkholderiaceae bacterium]
MSGSNQDLLADIQEINLSYLMLAQRLLRDDRATGMARLGIDDDVASLILQLSPAQLVRLASSSSVICGFRMNDYNLLSALTRDVLGGILQQAHSAILLSQQATRVPVGSQQAPVTPEAV